MLRKILRKQRAEYWFKSRVRKSYELAIRNIRQDEELLDAYLTISDDLGRCIIAITDKRMILAHKKLLGSKVKTISYRDISDIYMNEGLFFTKIIVDFLGDTQVLQGMKKEHSKLYNTLINII